MIKPAQSLREVLWELANHARKLEQSDLRRRMGMRYADLDPLLEELEKEDRISRQTSPTGNEMRILKKRQISRTKPGRGQGKTLVSILAVSIFFGNAFSFE